MIAELIPCAYDFTGIKISKPTGKRIRVFHPTFPMGRFLSQPLTKQFKDINELRRFLFTCKYVSDEEQFGKRDYWLPPEEFEKCRKGDCEDFALYTWRQLIEMRIKSRFVVGESGRYGSGHAWVAMQNHGKNYIIEPLACAFRRLPRLSMIRYIPEISVEYKDKKFSYCSHKRLQYNPSFFEALDLFREWLFFWVKKWLKAFLMLLFLPIRLLVRLISHNIRDGADRKR
jgi:hypothetical protein